MSHLLAYLRFGFCTIWAKDASSSISFVKGYIVLRTQCGCVHAYNSVTLSFIVHYRHGALCRAGPFLGTTALFSPSYIFHFNNGYPPAGSEEGLSNVTHGYATMSSDYHYLFKNLQSWVHIRDKMVVIFSSYPSSSADRRMFVVERLLRYKSKFCFADRRMFVVERLLRYKSKFCFARLCTDWAHRVGQSDLWQHGSNWPKP